MTLQWNGMVWKYIELSTTILKTVVEKVGQTEQIAATYWERAEIIVHALMLFIEKS